MAVELWPPIAPEEFEKAEEGDLKRELKWLVEELHDGLQAIRHGLEDCYALLAPIDPGSTLPLTTPGKELVKGVMTRVGTRISRGTIQVRMRTLPHQTLNIDSNHPIHITPLLTLTKLLDQAIDMLTLTLSVPTNAQFLHAQLRLLGDLLSEASDIIKGPPVIPASRDWTTESLSPLHFSPPLGAAAATSSTSSVFSSPGLMRGIEKDLLCPPMSLHVGLRNGNIVLALRVLEPVDAPVGFGTKLALAIGTTRRLEHDEADRVFSFTLPAEPHRPGSSASIAGSGMVSGAGTEPSPSRIGDALKIPPVLSGRRKTSTTSIERKKELEVYVREKVEVETGDPSLISLQSKLTSLGSSLALARKNLAIVLGEDDPDDLGSARIL